MADKPAAAEAPAPKEAQADEAAQSDDDAAFSEAFKASAKGEPLESEAQGAGAPAAPAAPPAPPAPPAPAAPGAPAAPVEEDDWADLTDEQRRERYLAARGRVRSEVPKLAARSARLERDLRDRERELEEMRKQLASGAATAQGDAGPGAPTAAEVKDAAKSPEKWAALKEQYPDLTGALEELVVSQVGEVERRVEQRIAPLTQEQQRRQQEQADSFHDEQLEALTEAHPDWSSLQEDPAYWAWVDQQTPGLKASAESPYAADVITAIERYKSERAGTPGAPAPASSVQDLVVGRQQRLRAASAIPPQRGSPASPHGQTTGDFSGAFQQAAREADQRRTAR